MSDNKIFPMITFNKLNEYVRKNSKEDFSDKLYSIFASADKEDINGKEFGEDAFPDGMLNPKEQQTFMQMLRDEHPKLFSLVDEFMSKLNGSAGRQQLLYNLDIMSNSLDYYPDKTAVEKSMQHIDNDNFIDIVKEFYEQGNEAFFVKLYDKINCGFIDDGGATEKMLVEKYKGYASTLLEKAKEKGIYTKDYEKMLNEAEENKDYFNYSVAIDRLMSRYIIETDEKQELGASKRKLELKEPNGKIDSNFVQGYTGNCWFISALATLASNEEFLNKLNSMLSVEKDGDEVTSVTVNIQGKDYKIDYEELKNANEYSSGDLDVRAFEIAVNRYMHDNNLGDIGLANIEESGYKYLFGEDHVKVNEYNCDEEDFDVQKYIEAMTGDNKNVLSILNSGSDLQVGNRTAFDSEGNEVRITERHAHTFSRVDSEYIYFRDPHKLTQELRIPIKDFSNTFLRVATIELI